MSVDNNLDIISKCLKCAIAGYAKIGDTMGLMLDLIIARYGCTQGIIGEKRVEGIFRYLAINPGKGMSENSVIAAFKRQGFADFMQRSGSLHDEVLLTCKPVIHVSSNDELFKEDQPMISVETNYIAYPLLSDGEIIGILALSRLSTFSEDDILLTYREIVGNLLLLAKNQESVEIHRIGFLANMSHELRTPLNGIVCMSSMLSETVMSNEQKEYMAIVMRCSSQLLDIINDILDYSKITTGHMQLDFKPVNIRRCLDNVCDIIGLKAHEKGIALNVTVDAAIPQLLIADDTRITQIFINIIGNAVKFTVKGTVSVDLSIHPNDSAAEGVPATVVVFTVKDTGVGMSPGALARVYNAFQQTGANYLEGNYGVGLGLPIVKHLIELFHGNITIDSKLGEGTTVTVCLPLNNFVEINLDELRRHYSKKNVLIIDDTPDRLVIFTAVAEVGCIPILCSRPEDVDLYYGALAPIYTIINQATPNYTDYVALLSNKEVIAIGSGSSSCSGLKVAYSITHPVDAKKVIEVFKVALSHPEKSDLHDSGIKPLIKILVAEDNILNQQVIQKLLNSLGFYNIEMVNNGLDMLRVLLGSGNGGDSGSYDICFVDLKMPGMDGITATKKFKADPLSNKKPVLLVAVTATMSEIVKEHCYAAGMNGYITKPIDRKELKGVMNIVIRKKIASMIG